MPTTTKSSKDSIPDWVPEWARELPGLGRILKFEPLPEFTSGAWTIQLALPNDMSEIETEPLLTDPLLLIMVGSLKMRELDEKMFELVAMARRQGRSWTEIGQALGVTKQTAWTKYSGED